MGPGVVLDRAGRGGQPARVLGVFDYVLADLEERGGDSPRSTLRVSPSRALTTPASKYFARVEHLHRRLVESSDTPVVVVPAEAVSPGMFRGLLVPLEGTDTTSRSVIEKVRPLIADEVEVVVLHVFTEATLPSMLDRPEYGREILGEEFLGRHFPYTTRIELRPGPVARQVGEVCAEQGADLIALSWSQDSSGDRATGIREVLAASPIPVLLLPAATLDMGPVDLSGDGGVPAERA